MNKENDICLFRLKLDDINLFSRFQNIKLNNNFYKIEKYKLTKLNNYEHKD